MPRYTCCRCIHQTCKRCRNKIGLTNWYCKRTISYNASYKYIPRDAGFCVAVSLCINHSKQKKTTFIFFVFASLLMILSVSNCFHIILNQFANAPKTCHNMISQRRTSPPTQKIGSRNEQTQLLLFMCFFPDSILLLKWIQADHRITHFALSKCVFFCFRRFFRIDGGSHYWQQLMSKVSKLLLSNNHPSKLDRDWYFQDWNMQ